MDIKQLLITMGIFALFVYSMFSFVAFTQTDSSINNSILENDLINDTYKSLNTSLSSTSAEKVSNNFSQTPPTQQFGELEVTSIFSITRTGKTIIKGFWNILIVLPLSVLGLSPIVTTIIGSILFLFIIIGIWAIWKGAIT